ncbi:MAG: hypothetical protein J3R72DRAFT_530549 [Linnemannia gamsii]|nr:MAG: hypothetical protein J3R72DRAFT_530549 [Linnemannia gamsii]
MMLRNIFILMSLLIVLVTGYGTPRIQHNGRQVGAGTTPGRAVRHAINMALSTLSAKIQNTEHGEVVTADELYQGHRVTAMYAPSHSYINEVVDPPSGTQLANGIYKLIEPSARSLYEYGYCALKNNAQCTSGIMTYHYHVPPENLKRNSAPSFANSSYTTGIHYLPRNDTLHAKIMPSESSRVNDAGPFCKRGDNWTMNNCAYTDTLIAGYPIKTGTRLYSDNGFYMEFQADQNICTTHRNGNKYWCMMVQNQAGKAPFTAMIDAMGNLDFKDKNGKWNGGVSNKGPSDYQYRLRMQNDGNLVFYRGETDENPIWASHPGKAPYPAYVPTPCQRRFLIY